MEDIANVATKQQQQQQIQTQNTSQSKTTQTVKEQDVVKELQEEVSTSEIKINSKEQMQNLVDSLNKAIAPISTNLSFAVDKDDIFYVSVRETESQRLIRRFPAEQAVAFLPKMQEVTGMLFDTRG